MEGEPPWPQWSQHPSGAAVFAVGRAAASMELHRVVGSLHAEALKRSVDQTMGVLACEAPAGTSQAAWQAAQVEGLFDLVRQCIGLAAAVDEGLDDGTAAAGSDAGDVIIFGWDFGVVVAEAITNGLAALACGLDMGDGEADAVRDGASMDVLERLSVELDVLACCLFGGLNRLRVQEFRQLRPRELRLLRALQGICVWTLTALGRVVGYGRLSSGVLWEWVSGDAAWALTLAKGVLSTTLEDLADLQAGDSDTDPFVVPADLGDLQHAVLLAVLGLASPSVAFGSEPSEEAIGIEIRNAEMACHRAELAVAAAGCGLLEVLPSAAAARGCAAAAGPRLASFLVGLLQPDLALNPEWANASETTLATVHESKRAAAIFASRLGHETVAVWELLAEVPRALGSAGLPPGFLRDCADLAYATAPPPMEVNKFLAACLDGGSSQDFGLLGALCILAANSILVPEDGGPLKDVMLRIPADAYEAVVTRWEQWRGPVQFAQLWQWNGLLITPPTFSRPAPPEERAPLPPAPAYPPPPPPKGAVLGTLVHEAAPEFCCCLDGQLMMDPVCSPLGYVFDRSALARALKSGGGLCPMTQQPLALEDCSRLPDLRKRIQVWVRQQSVKNGREKPKLGAAVSRRM